MLSVFFRAHSMGCHYINEEMKRACVYAIAELARREATDLGSAYSGETPRFGPDCLIPRPFDPRLLVSLTPAVAKAAMDSGVATRPITDMGAYRDQLSQWVFRSGLLMKPVFDKARENKKRVAYAEGEEETVLRAVQTVVDEGGHFRFWLAGLRDRTPHRAFGIAHSQWRRHSNTRLMMIRDATILAALPPIDGRKGIPSGGKAVVRARDTVMPR